LFALFCGRVLLGANLSTGSKRLPIQDEAVSRLGILKRQKITASFQPLAVLRIEEQMATAVQKHDYPTKKQFVKQ